jgi:hypothetical protein
MSDFAADFEPIARIADAGGPMKTTPAFSQASAKSAFSDRMDCLRPGSLGDVQDALADKIGFTRGGRTDEHCLVRQSNVARIGVGLGIHRDGRYPEPFGCFDDAACDFTAVRD